MYKWFQTPFWESLMRWLSHYRVEHYRGLETFKVAIWKNNKTIPHPKGFLSHIRKNQFNPLLLESTANLCFSKMKGTS